MDDNNSINRRDLLERGSLLALGLLVGGAAGLRAEELKPTPSLLRAADDDVPASPVSCAVIGLGDQGRAILTSLSYVPGATVAYVCDTYAPAHKRALEIHPKATAVTDYKQVLNDKKVQAIFIATPTHQHKQVVLDALAAGKNVYCEAPLAHTIDDARAIAAAGKAAAPKQIFHAGLQQRTEPQHKHVVDFVRIGALGPSIAQSKGQWHRKTSWRRPAPTDARQNALNWRLDKGVSTGLIGEVGIHQVDVTNWFAKKLPVSVTGFGGVLAWNDGREVPDTIQCVFQYPNGMHLAYDATLANSFDGEYELFQGMDSAVMIRDQRAWMFKESDAPALGWEVYAYKEKVGDDTGIALVADASKLLAKGLNPSEHRSDPTNTPMYYAAKAFLDGIRTGKPTAAGPLEGFQATVTALKANEAVTTGTKVAYTPEMFII